MSDDSSIELGPRDGPDYMSRYRKKNKDKFKKYAREHFKNNPDLYLYWSVKGRANRSGLPFNLEKTDIVIPSHCPVLGIPLFRNTGGKRPTANSPSVDRIIPELGYVKGNIQVISQRANVMKNDASPDELRRFAEWVRNTFPH